MRARVKKILSVFVLSILIFSIGFLISSGLLSELTHNALDRMSPFVKLYIRYQIANRVELYPNSRYYLLFTGEEYLKFYKEGPSIMLAFSILSNALINFLFQPLFLCVFTPQAIMNFILFPFFLYGAVKYFARVPLIVIFFTAFAIYIGLNDFFIEPLIRHRMSCELVYLLIGLAGLVKLTTER